MKPVITVIKRNPAGEETWRYRGQVILREVRSVVIEARFNRADLPFMGTVLRNGDRFLEVYFTDRWYNIYEVHDLEDDGIKGWYCNIGRPAVWESEDVLSYVDLALDLWVGPGGRQTVLDQEEFAALALDSDTRRQALEALEGLKLAFASHPTPAEEAFRSVR